ncbi:MULTISPECIES: hypothetical protein [Mycobacteriaceae]|uniref:hypothetical protein n=1 Tax=Mycobacteriaceae TaxID=1762 RepID=UPI000379F32B|nr:MULTISPECIES: hypothetical protein [Mycobacteriaceae]AXK74704.1 hypothetical protein DXK33_05845 [Mycolicibacterium neoaurum]
MGKHSRHRAAAGLDPLVALPGGDQAFELVDDGPVLAGTLRQLAGRIIDCNDWADIRLNAQIMDTPEARVQAPNAAATLRELFDRYHPV